MIVVDCRDVKPIKNELAVYVSDQVAALPTLKNNEFILSPVLDEEQISKTEVITAIKEFLDSVGESRHFAVISKYDTILIKSIDGKIIERESNPSGQMFTCQHCGFVTQYEVEHNNHMKIHYL